jgi:FKBP-type peptidyl-prolyl cis-trans isomerase FkpA
VSRCFAHDPSFHWQNPPTLYKGFLMPTTETGLQYEDTTVGTGAVAVKGHSVTVHYTGWLYNDNTQGAKFDSSKDRNDPFVFHLGAGMVIRGWDEGVAGMKVGGARTLIIPAALGYGARGAGGVIPPNATLKFDVELLGTSD